GRLWVIEEVGGTASAPPAWRIYRSADGGSSLTPLADPCQAYLLAQTLSVAPGGVVWLGCGGNYATIMEQRQLFVSLDGGTFWRTAYSGAAQGHLFDVSAASPEVALLFQDRTAVSLTVDGGATSTHVLGGFDAATIDGGFLDATHAVAVDNTSFYSSTDGGRTWSTYVFTATPAQ
ncbi:MAG: WD40/YVTN/BNR-like repeat-containing protein, partial [Mycobacteriales bacterium]